MKKVIQYIVCCSLLFLSACSDNFTNSSTDTGKLVVDGYIEAGKYARVILTNSIAIDSEIDSSKYLDIVTTRASIRLTDGDDYEYLTLKWNKDAFPQHFYESIRIKGEAGKHYSLDVFYNNDSIHAETYVPEPIDVDSIWLVPSQLDSSKYYLWAKFCDDATEDNYYRSFTKTQNQEDFVPTYLSAFDDKLFNGECNNVALYKGVENFFEKKKDERFLSGDTIFFKASTVDEAGYLFWTNYEKEVFNLGNPFSGHGANLESNINGGIGVWCGYNSKVYRIIVP